LRKVTWLALAALVVGLVAGAALSASGVPGLERLIGFLEPIGTLWVNAVRMTIIPLVISMLVVAVASSDSLRSMGRLGGTALGFFLITLVVIAAYTAVLGPMLLGNIDIDPTAAAALRATAEGSSTRIGETVRSVGGFGQRLVELIPTNAFAAASSGAILPLVIFSIIFGAALSRLPLERRAPVVQFFGATADAMLVVVRWVFLAAPIGVLALATVVGARLGYDAVGAVALYVAVFVGLMMLAMVLMYVAAVVIGRVPLRLFAAAVAPAQVIALGSRSSSAALPAQLQSARDILKLPGEVTSFVLPSAVAVFRVSAPVSFVLGALLLGELYGVPISGAQIVSLAILSILVSYSVPPVPSGSVFLMAPVFTDMGIPAEGVAILIAIDVIPDLAKTVAIVTSHLASAVVVSRLTR
jgi:proton glutamate symport protein